MKCSLDLLSKHSILKKDHHSDLCSLGPSRSRCHWWCSVGWWGQTFYNPPSRHTLLNWKRACRRWRQFWQKLEFPDFRRKQLGKAMKAGCEKTVLNITITQEQGSSGKQALLLRAGTIMQKKFILPLEHCRFSTFFNRAAETYWGFFSYLSLYNNSQNITGIIKHFSLSLRMPVVQGYCNTAQWILGGKSMIFQSYFLGVP